MRIILPHDGAHGNKVFATSYESAVPEAGGGVLAKRVSSGLENRQSEAHIRLDGDNCAMQLRRRVQTH
jgi:hypothetical protein